MTIEHDDGLPDDRVHCGTCANFKPAGKYCQALRMVTWSDLPVRCLKFMARAGDPDQRNGRERWPDLDRTIAETRELDRTFHEQLEAATA